MPAPLLLTRRFLPLFMTQGLGALNDNLFKNALVVLIVFRGATSSEAGGGAALIALAGGVFILPYLLFSATAGQLADRFDKARLIRINKAAEVALMLAGAACLLSGSIPLLLAILFGLGVQAAFSARSNTASCRSGSVRTSCCAATGWWRPGRSRRSCSAPSRAGR